MAVGVAPPMTLMPGTRATPVEPGIPETPVTLVAPVTPVLPRTPASRSTAAMQPAPDWWLGTENPPLPESQGVERLKS
jgi:hypothetical protein